MTQVSSPLIRVAITGPESTGKSALSEWLATYYGTLFVPEYARQYIDTLNRPYQCEDIVHIAKGQLTLEKELESKASQILITDTELTVTRIWSLHKCGYCDPWIENQIHTHKYDLLLLCDIDLPWEYDPQREHPHLRAFFFDWYQRELRSRGERFEIVRGEGELRYMAAVAAIEKHFPNINRKR